MNNTRNRTKFTSLALLAIFVFSANVGRGATCVINGIEWEYKIVSDGVAITKGTVPEDATQIIIPSQIDGCNVVELSSSCLEDYDKIGASAVCLGNLYDITLPSFVKRIKSRAFFERKFTHMEFPETLEELDQFALGWYGNSFPWGNGTTYKAGAHPIEVIDQVVFWGQLPVIKNEGSLSYSRSFTSSTGNYMFWKAAGSTKVYVDEKYYGSGGFYCQGILMIGFSSPQIVRTAQMLNGYGNNVTINIDSENSPSIFYTVDGSEPTTKATENCYLYGGETLSFACNRTIKAIAYVASYPYTKTVVGTFGIGKSVDPDCVSTQGGAFWNSGNEISLTSATTDAIIHYTLDDSEVTTNSPIYTMPFVISDTTTVRAKAFKEDWFDSEEIVQTFTRLWYTNETPVVSAAAETFDTTSQEVTLSCDTKGATIYYTIDGGEPSATNGRVYKGPFDIYQTTTVKAIAVKDDWKDSAVASATFTKANEVGPAINMLEVLPDNDKTHPWTVVNDVTHDGVSAVKSGEISDDESTTMKVVIYGAGELSFWWRTSCEPTIGGEWYDFATFYDGTTAVTNLAGVTDWQRIVRTVEGTGKHTFKWTYQKDGSGSTVPDGVWVDQVQWLPKTDDWYSDHTLTTEAPVKYDWLRKYGLAIEDDFETAAKAATGKSDGTGHELTVEDDFVAGTDPTNELSHLEAKIEMTNGVPIVRWTPDLNEDGSKDLRTYKIWGKETLDDTSDWEYPTNSLHHFFKVTVEMP